MTNIITRTMKKWLQDEYPNLIKKKGSVKVAVYLGRIQNRIEREMKMLLWLAVNFPNVLLGKFEHINEYGHKTKWSKDKSHERTKTLMLVIKALQKNAEVELVKNA